MGKTLLLVLVAAVVGSTYIRLNQSESDIAAADSHRGVQAEQLAEDVAMGGRAVVLGRMVAPGGGAFLDSSAFAALVPMDTAVAYQGRPELGHYNVTRYRADGDEVTFQIEGKHYKDLIVDAAGNETWEHASHVIRATYTLQGIPGDFETPEPQEFISRIASGASCAANDFIDPDGIDMGGDLHFGDEPRLVRIQGDLNVPNNRRLDGTGLLVVEGDLAVRGELFWDGVVLVYNENNDMVIDLDRARQVEITGALLLGDQIDVQDVLDTNQGANADPGALGGLLTAAGGTFDFDADNYFSLEYDAHEVFLAAECIGVASYVLAQKGTEIVTTDDTEDDGHVCRNNNGHGNNADGVDSSNPGQGHGGPNGEPDESCSGDGACVDDETRP